MQRPFRRSVAGFVALAVASLASGVGTAQEITYAPTQVSEHVWLLRPSDVGIGNSVAVVGSTGVVLVDTGMPSGARAVLAALGEISDQPVTHLVNTHWHDDHVWGNQVVADAYPSASLLGHAHTRDDLLEQAVPALVGNIERLSATLVERDRILESGREEDGNPLAEDRRAALEERQALFRQALLDLRAIEATPPNRLVDDQERIDVGELEVRVMFLGRGHTRGDLVVWVPADGVAIVGDLLVHPFPAAAEAWIDEWPATLDAIVALQPAAIVPGHGPVFRDLEYLGTVRGLLASVVDQVGRSVAAGMDLETIAERVDVSAYREQLAGDDARLQAGFDRFFLQPAIESAWARATGAR